MRRLPQVERKLRESGSSAGSEAPHSGPVPTAEQLAATLAHDVNNPLAVIIANLDFLGEVMPQVGLEASAVVRTPALASRLAEAELALQDARAAAWRIRDAVKRVTNAIVLPEEAGVRADKTGPISGARGWREEGSEE